MGEMKLPPGMAKLTQFVEKNNASTEKGLNQDIMMQLEKVGGNIDGKADQAGGSDLT